MSISNSQWIGVDHGDRPGYSYIKLQDVDRITLNQALTSDGNSHFLSLFIRDVEYIYAKGQSSAQAQEKLRIVFGLIDTAHGRKPNEQAA